MRIKPTLILFPLLILTLLLGSCGPKETPVPTATPTLTPTITPTARRLRQVVDGGLVEVGLGRVHVRRDDQDSERDGRRGCGCDGRCEGGSRRRDGRLFGAATAERERQDQKRE